MFFFWFFFFFFLLLLFFFFWFFFFFFFFAGRNSFVPVYPNFDKSIFFSLHCQQKMFPQLRQWCYARKQKLVGEGEGKIHAGPACLSETEWEGFATSCTIWDFLVRYPIFRFRGGRQLKTNKNSWASSAGTEHRLYSRSRKKFVLGIKEMLD